MAPPYRALSLDLWFTTLVFQASDLPTWEELRSRTLSEVLALHDGRSPSQEEARRALAELRKDLARGGFHLDRTEPARVLELLADALGARVRGSLEHAARRLSDAGLYEAPPEVNPEVLPLVRSLRDEGVPVIAITNTGRLASTWLRFFERVGGPAFDHVLTSCEAGSAKPEPVLFHLAAERLGLAAAEVLHVGDRWDLDVEGALRAGMGAALYTGLWSRYPPSTEYSGPGPGREDPRVLRLERLGDLLVPGRFERGASAASRTSASR